jgi:hypothetical protein
MKIYRVYMGKVRSAEVIKETSLYYRLNGDDNAFGWATMVDKATACLTPLEAIKESLNEKFTAVNVIEDLLVKLKFDVLNLERLSEAEMKKLERERNEKNNNL